MWRGRRSGLSLTVYHTLKIHFAINIEVPRILKQKCKRLRGRSNIFRVIVGNASGCAHTHCEGLRPELIQLGVADNLSLESLKKSKHMGPPERLGTAFTVTHVINIRLWPVTLPHSSRSRRIRPMRGFNRSRVRLDG
jgi:hypothetical protein